MFSMRHSIGFSLSFLAAAAMLLGCGSGGGNGGTGGGGSANAPVLTSISPTSAASGSPGVTITLTGSNFATNAQAHWNASILGTSYQSSTSLIVHVPDTFLESTGTETITVTNPPNGGTSTGLQFIVESPLLPGQSMINVDANDLAWDPVRQVMYLSTNNGIQVVNPATGQLIKFVAVAGEPNLLSISKSAEYLYVGLNGASDVLRLTLPDLTTDLTIPLGTDPENFAPYYAMDLQAGPVSDGTVAVTRAVLNESISLEYGGVQIYDDGVMRPQSLCGFGQGGCTSLGGATDTFESIQWNSNGTEMFSANEDAGAGDFYRISVSSTGFGAISDYPGVAGNDDANIFEIEYDPMTDRVYDEDGNIIDPNSGVRIGTFPAAGILAVDGSLGKAFFLKPISEDSSTYLLKSFDIHTLAPIATMQIQGSPQAPTHLIRWGTDGLAFTTCLNEDGDSLNCTKNIGTPGPVYVVQGSFVSGN